MSNKKENDVDFNYGRFDYRGETFKEYMMRNDDFYQDTRGISPSTVNKVREQWMEKIEIASDMFPHRDHDAHVFDYYDSMSRYKIEDWE